VSGGEKQVLIVVPSHLVAATAAVQTKRMVCMVLSRGDVAAVGMLVKKSGCLFGTPPEQEEAVR